MTLRIIAKGRGETRPLVVLFFFVEASARLVAAMMPNAIVLLETASVGAETWAAIEAKAAQVAPLGPRIVCGYSAGCIHVRNLWTAGMRPDALVLVDGTHTDKPPRGQQLSGWQEIVEAGRAGERLVVASHIYNLYSDSLADPFLSTVTVLRQVTGLELPEPEDEHPRCVTEGRLSVVSCRSTDCDAQAHRDQQNVLFPRLVKEWLVPLYGPNQDEAPTLPPERPAWLNPELTLGQRCVLWSQAEMAANVREVPPGSNGGPRIAEYFGVCLRNGKSLGIKSGAWCAAAASFAHVSCSLGAEYPIPRASGAEMVTDAKIAKRWHPVTDLRTGKHVPRVGDILIFDRSSEGVSWGRHVARVVEWREHDYTTIDANHGDRWSTVKSDAFNPKLLGSIDV